MEDGLHAVVLAGGELGDVIASDVPNASLVVAADSGLHHAAELKLHVDVVVGDLDSVDHMLLHDMLLHDIEIERHDVAKDATDLELAIDYAVRRGASAITVVGGVGGRLDHWLGNVFALTRPELEHIRMNAVMGRYRLNVVRGELTLTGAAGELVSLFPMHGPVEGLTIEGLRWSGHFDQVGLGSSLCVSNEFASDTCRIEVRTGVMLAVHELRGRSGRSE